MPTFAPTESFAFEALVESLDDVVFRADRDGRWTYLNPAFEKRLGWTVAQALGRGVARYLHPAERRDVLDLWRETLHARNEACECEVRFLHAAGGERWMLVSARGQRDAGGELCSVTGTLTDITAAKSTAVELHAARAAAEAANKAKSEFLSTMSHELRTPLNAVIGLSESLLEFGAPFDPARTQRYLGIIHSSGRQLLAQINDILDLARIETGRIKVQPEWFDARAICAGALEQVQREVRAKQIVARLDAAATAEMLHGDERLLRQVLQNLISNAVKFTPKAGSVCIRLRRRTDGALIIDVSDTGIGIAPEKLPLLFKPFSQVDSSMARQFGGTGLGLALVERIVRLHRGSVAVQSTPGAGSTFTVELPPSTDQLPMRPRTARSRRIVLVDDDPCQHTLVGDYLRGRGFDVVSCENAEAALREIAAREPGLALIDINMPGMSGLELIARLRQSPQWRELPIVAVTAQAEADDVERCRAAGASAHLPKPISLPALLQRITSLGGRSP